MLTLSFLRDYYRIPKKYKLGWAIIVEQKDGSKKCRLGLILKGTSKAVDVMSRKFIQTEILYPIERKVYPAKKKIFGDCVQFQTISEEVCETVCLKKETLTEEYFVSKYSPELMEAFLL